MNKMLLQYAESKRKLLRYFDCPENYSIRICADCHWRLLETEGATFLEYRRADRAPTKAVVVNKDGAPLVYRTKDLAMIIAIDCIKIAFIMDTVKEGK